MNGVYAVWFFFHQFDLIERQTLVEKFILLFGTIQVTEDSQTFYMFFAITRKEQRNSGGTCVSYASYVLGFQVKKFIYSTVKFWDSMLECIEDRDSVRSPIYELYCLDTFLNFFEP